MAREKVGQAIRDVIKQRRASKKKSPMSAKAPTRSLIAQRQPPSFNPDQVLSTQPGRQSQLAYDTTFGPPAPAPAPSSSTSQTSHRNLPLTDETLSRSRLFATHVASAQGPRSAAGDGTIPGFSGIGSETLTQRQDNFGFVPPSNSFDPVAIASATVSELLSSSNENPPNPFQSNASFQQQQQGSQMIGTERNVASSQISLFNLGSQVDTRLDQGMLAGNFASSDGTNDPSLRLNSVGQFWSGIDTSFLPIRTIPNPTPLMENTTRRRQFSREEIEEAKQPTSSTMDSDTQQPEGPRFGGQFPPF